MPDNRAAILKSQAVRYGVAIVAPGAAAALYLVLSWSLGGKLPTFILFYPVVMFVAVMGGLRAGLLATAVSALLTDYWIIPPEGFGIDSLRDGVGLGLFIAMGVFMSVVAELYHRSRRKVAAYDRELALSQSRQDLNRAQAVAHVGSWRLNVRTNELVWSDEAHRIFGIPVGTPMTYEAFLAAVHPDDRDRIDRDWKAALGGKPYDTEHRIMVGQAVKWVRELGELEFDRGGSPLGGFGTVQDVTERKQAEEEVRHANVELEKRVEERTQELRLASRYARSLLEASLDPLVTISPEGKITDVNQATEQVTGVPRARLIGSDFSQYFTEPGKASAGYRQVIAQGLVRDYPLTIRHVSGATADVLYNATVYRNEAGEVQGVFAAARDITDRKRAEDALRASELRYRTLFETMDEGFCVVEMIYDLEGKPVDYRFVEVNPAFEKHTGLHNGLGKTIRELVPSHEAHWFETYGKVARTGEAVRFENIAEAMHRIYDVFAFRIGQAENPRVGILFKDITDQKRAETALHEAYETLEQRVTERTADLARSNKDLEQFAYVASHDLQEPLRAVGGFVGLLQRRYQGKLDASADEFIRGAVDGAQRMQTLIGDLLAYSRVGTHNRAIEPTNARAALDRAIANLQAAIRESGAVVTGQGLPVVPADPVQLTQLLQNLVGNAIKFRGDGRPEIHVRATREQGHWLFAVQDNGIGIEPQYAERIFLIFQRLHTREKYPGTGVGLAICRRIVERHGGRIWVESQPQAGSTFYFTLPDETEAAK